MVFRILTKGNILGEKFYSQSRAFDLFIVPKKKRAKRCHGDFVNLTFTLKFRAKLIKE